MSSRKYFIIVMSFQKRKIKKTKTLKKNVDRHHMRTDCDKKTTNYGVDSINNNVNNATNKTNTRTRTPVQREKCRAIP